MKEKLESVPPDSYELINISRSDFIDVDIIDVINGYSQHAHLKNIHVEIKKSLFKAGHQLVYDQSTIGNYILTRAH